MKNDLASVIRKVSTFLSRPVAEENIPSLVDHLSFDKMKKNKSVNKQEFVEVGCIENDHTSHKMLKAYTSTKTYKAFCLNSFNIGIPSNFRRRQ